MDKISARPAILSDQGAILHLLDEFRSDCIEQITQKPATSTTAIEYGKSLYKELLDRKDYAIFIAANSTGEVCGVITGYLCPMLRSGSYRAEVEEFFVTKTSRGTQAATLLMDAFVQWSKSNGATKVNLESDCELSRAHSFYKKYGFITKAQRFVQLLQ